MVFLSVQHLNDPVNNQTLKREIIDIVSRFLHVKVVIDSL